MTPEEFKKVALSNAEIRRCIDKNAIRKHELQSCIEALAENSNSKTEHDVVSAVCKAYDALIDGVKIFISYKFGSRHIVDAFLSPILMFAGHRLKVDDKWPFIAETSTKAGTAWSAITTA